MQNIGERLEEARKRQGVSIREAAEATKVRADFLTNFENNHFDFDLPDVYKRGFLRLYARFLKLDVDKVLIDYQAVVLGSSKHAKSESKEFFGRMDLHDNIPTLAGELADPPLHNPHAEPHSPKPMGSAPADVMEHETNTSIYWKIGLPIGATAIIALLAFVLVMWLTDDKGNTTQSLTADEPSLATNTSDGTLLDYDIPNVNTDLSLSPLVITSRGDTRLLVRQENDSRILYDQIIRAGEQVSLERVGPVLVFSSDFHFLTIDINDRVYHAQAEGIGKKIFY